jgi:hypothetical protein
MLPGQVALLMSMFGSASYAWTFHDMDESMYPNVESAHSQSTMWVRACLDLLDHCRRSSIRSFEALQAIVIAFFMLVNLEGMTLRYTSMVSQAICMAREIGLHRLDHPNYATSDHAPRVGTITEEIGRRIWWYLCATDWYASFHLLLISLVFGCVTLFQDAISLCRTSRRRILYTSTTHGHTQAMERKR